LAREQLCDQWRHRWKPVVLKSTTLDQADGWISDIVSPVARSHRPRTTESELYPVEVLEAKRVKLHYSGCGSSDDECSGVFRG
jgi:hypothetical protein